jgi:hypothetical protein
VGHTVTTGLSRWKPRRVILAALMELILEVKWMCYTAIDLIVQTFKSAINDIFQLQNLSKCIMIVIT